MKTLSLHRVKIHVRCGYDGYILEMGVTRYSHTASVMSHNHIQTVIFGTHQCVPVSLCFLVYKELIDVYDKIEIGRKRKRRGRIHAHILSYPPSCSPHLHLFSRSPSVNRLELTLESPLPSGVRAPCLRLSRQTLCAIVVMPVHVRRLPSGALAPLHGGVRYIT